MNTPENKVERELQESIERELQAGSAAEEAAFSGAQEDMEAYRMLFHSLNDKPVIGPSYGFSVNVITKIQLRKDFMFRFWWNLLLPLGILLVVSITYIAATRFHSAFARMVIELVLQFKWQLVLGVCCFFIVQYLDQQLVRKKVLHNS